MRVNLPRKIRIVPGDKTTDMLVELLVLHFPHANPEAGFTQSQYT
jgi:hypothetical protein